MGTRMVRWLALGLAALISSMAVKAADTSAPTTPTNLAASAVTATTITACWSASTDNVAVTGYQVWLGNTAVSVGASTLCNTFTGLLSGHSYNLTVRATDAAGNWSALAKVVSATTTAVADTTPPTEPGALSLSNITATGATVSWGASTDNVGVAGYQLWVGNSHYQVSASTLQYTLTGLISGSSYNLAVRAEDAAGNWSALTPVVKLTTLGTVAAPTVPTNVTTSAITSTGFTLSWTASTDAVGVTAYQVWVGNKAYSVAPTATSYTVTGLTASTSYNTTVRATDAAGNWSALAPVISVTTLSTTPTGTPSTPGAVSVSAITTTGFTVSWGASTESGTGTLDHYLVTIGSTTVSVAAANTSYTATGLTAGTTYSVTVKAVDAAGNVSSATTAVSATTSVVSLPSTPGAVTITAISTTGFTVNWGASTESGTGTLDHYLVTIGSTTVSVAAANTTYTATGLTAGTTYSVTVKAVDAAGNVSSATTAVSATTTAVVTPPTTPGTVTITAINATGFTVNWGASTETGSGTLDHYLVTIGTTSVSVPAADTSYVATGLTTGTSYSVTVKAVDTAGNSSTATTAVTATPDNTAVVYYYNSNSWTSVNIHYGISGTWTTAPGVAMTLACTGYWTKTINLGSATALAVDFNNGTTWDNNSGNNYSLSSGTSVVKSGVVTANAASPCTPDTTPPTTPGAVVATAITSSGFTATWTASTDNVGVDHYILTVGSTSITVAGTLTTYAVTGLTSSTTYSVTVKAYDAAGNASSASTATSVTTTTVDTTPPSVPTGVTATASTSACSIVLTWTASTDNVGVIGYNVLRNGTKLGSVTSTTYTDSAVTAGTSYSYTVSAYDAAGNASAVSSAASATASSSCTAASFTLGVMYTSSASTFSLWSPDSSNVVLYLDGSTYPMSKIADTNGYTNVYSVTVPGDWNLKQYNFQVNGVTSRDPYGIMVVPGTNYDVVIDPSQTNLTGGWSATPTFTSRDDAIIYETHVRDFTIDSSSGVPTAEAGTFAAMTLAGTTVNGTTGAPSTGIDHLVDMGVTHVQIMPVFDFGSCDPAEVAANSSCYNWGYDPVNYNVPEWRYSLTPNDYIGRIKEFKAMVDGFHKRGIRVIMDVVYNHTYTTSVLGNITSQYYTSTDLSGTGNSLNGEVSMVSRMIQDSLEHWVRDYNIDGFRFDLLGVFDYATANTWGTYLTQKYPDRNLLLYGEPWNGTGTDPLEAQRVRFSTIGIISGSHMGVFNGEYRTALKGDDNDGSGGGYIFNQGTTWGSTWSGTALGEGPISVGMKASPRAVQGTTALSNIWDPMFSMAPEQSINYFDVHDNLCMADKIAAWAALNGESSNTTYIARLQQFALSILLTSEGIPLIDGGAEFQRTKQGNDNSYNASDSVNAVNWNLLVTNAATYAYTKDLIALRKAHSGLRMTSWSQVNTNVQSDQRSASLVYTLIDSAANSDTWNQELVIFNSGSDQVITLPSGNWTIAVEQSSPTTGVGTVVSGTVTAAGTAVTVLHQ